jgi:hypothetical protein
MTSPSFSEKTKGGCVPTGVVQATKAIAKAVIRANFFIYNKYTLKNGKRKTLADARVFRKSKIAD